MKKTGAVAQVSKPPPSKRSVRGRPKELAALVAPARVYWPVRPVVKPVAHTRGEEPVGCRCSLCARDVRRTAVQLARPGRKSRARLSGARSGDPSSEDAEAYAQLSVPSDGTGSFDISDTDEYIEGIAAGFLDRRLLARLRRGDFAIQGHVDLTA